VNADEEHIRAVLAFIRPHKNVIDYELLPYHRFGLASTNSWARCMNWTITKRRPMKWSSISRPSSMRPSAAAAKRPRQRNSFFVF